MFNFKEWEKKNVVMHCKTETEAKAFCKEMHNAGLTWITGGSYIGDEEWGFYEEETCYEFNKGKYAEIGYFIKYGYVVLEYEDYIQDK